MPRGRSKGPDHGSRRGFRSGCKCDLCLEYRERDRAHRAAYRQRLKAKPKSTEKVIYTHGRSGYDHGCRCEVCMTARRDSWNQWSAKKRTERAELLAEEERVAAQQLATLDSETPCHQRKLGDPEVDRLWFAKPGTVECQMAKTICMQFCDRYQTCAENALAFGIAEGVYGGQDEDERKRAWEKQGGRPSDPILSEIETHARKSAAKRRQGLAA